MKQLLLRLDDDLHRRLRERAAREGRSTNRLVTELLAEAIEGDDDRAVLRRRLAAAGMLVTPPIVRPLRSRDEVIESTRGAGTAVSDALFEERSRP
jgi:antitoxin FitA